MPQHTPAEKIRSGISQQVKQDTRKASKPVDQGFAPRIQQGFVSQSEMRVPVPDIVSKMGVSVKGGIHQAGQGE